MQPGSVSLEDFETLNKRSEDQQITIQSLKSDIISKNDELR